MGNLIGLGSNKNETKEEQYIYSRKWTTNYVTTTAINIQPLPLQQTTNNNNSNKIEIDNYITAIDTTVVSNLVSKKEDIWIALLHKASVFIGSITIQTSSNMFVANSNTVQIKKLYHNYFLHLSQNKKDYIETQTQTQTDSRKSKRRVIKFSPNGEYIACSHVLYNSNIIVSCYHIVTTATATDQQQQNNNSIQLVKHFNIELTKNIKCISDLFFKQNHKLTDQININHQNSLFFAASDGYLFIYNFGPKMNKFTLKYKLMFSYSHPSIQNSYLNNQSNNFLAYYQQKAYKKRQTSFVKLNVFQKNQIKCIQCFNKIVVICWICFELLPKCVELWFFLSKKTLISTFWRQH